MIKEEIKLLSNYTLKFISYLNCNKVFENIHSSLQFFLISYN